MLAFSAETRRADLERMADRQLDLLVIGGGIIGSGVALDAASRGLSVGLVERDDFAAGTSGRSSRLIHGGVRYLEHYQFDVVHESLRERAILLRLAPHLIEPIPIYTPTRTRVQRHFFRLGLVAYDVLAFGRNIGRDRYAGASEIARAVPGLGRPRPGVLYHECRTDDARLTLEVARTARAYGALVANHAEVTGLLSSEGRVQGARVLDGIGGESLDVRARLTVNAAGVWAEAIQGLATDAPKLLRPSKGVHLVFRPGAVETRTGVLVPSVGHDGRFLFVIPWGGRVYAGTTDTAYDGDLEGPTVTPQDFDYIFDAMQASFPSLTRDDVVASWAGLRPLLAGGPPPHGGGPSPTVEESAHHVRARTADLSRKHALYETPPGLLTITGGKLTAFRSMAEDAVDSACRDLGIRQRSRTRLIALGFHGDLAVALEQAQAEAVRLRLPPQAGRRMVRRFGDDWTEALERIREDGSLGQPAVDGLPVLRVELDLARVREMALTDQDVLVRRTRMTTMNRMVEESAAR